MSERHPPDTWGRIEAHFQDLVELDEPDRAARLAALEEETPEIAHEVRSLLQAHLKADTLLARARRGIAEVREAAGAPSMTGRKVGAHTLLRELGRGGMGTVWLAARSDEEYEKLVAIKLLDHPASSPHLVERLRTERQILARLEHPHIARLLDGGTTEDGQPFLVMEFVDGQTIERYCDENRLPVRRRLELFEKVCRAVQFAHRNLVVHRDLKPSNILVGADGEPKLLDFGIAKVLDVEQSSAAGPQTRPGLAMMTPEYASPEQIEGEPITTSSDVYSLGILLYQLLAGVHPFQRQSRSKESLLRAILELPPERPSASWSRAREPEKGTASREELARARSSDRASMERTLRGDLDLIVLKALRKEPERRYPSAHALAADVQSYLAGQPVSAHPDSLVYRAGKWMRRRKLTAALLALILLFSAGLATSLWQHRMEARQQHEHRLRVAEFLAELFQAADPGRQPNSEITARELLDRGRVRLDSVLADRPEIRADLLMTISDAYRRLGLYADAHECAAQALALRTDRFGSSHPSLVGPTLAMGQVSVAMADFERGESELAEVMALLDRHGGQEGPNRIRALVSQASLARHRGQVGDAKGLLEKAVALADRADSQDESTRTAEASALIELAQVDVAAPPETTVSRLREALHLYLELHGPLHPTVATTQRLLGARLTEAGRFDEALPLLEGAESSQRKLYGARHPELAITLNELGALSYYRNEFRAAIGYLHDAIAMHQETFGEDHPELAMSYNNLAEAHRRLHELPAAAEAFQKSLRLIRMSYGDRHPYVALSLTNIASLEIARERHQEALVLLAEASQIHDGNQGVDPVDRAILENKRGMALQGLGRFDEALDALNRAGRILETERSQADWMFGENLYFRGVLAAATGDTEAAIRLSRQAAENFAASLGDSALLRGRALYLLARSSSRAGRPEAGAAAAEAATILAGALPEGHRERVAATRLAERLR